MDISRPHALAFAFPGQGHVNPLIHLCSKLASMGFIITFVNAASFHNKVASQQVVSDSFRFRSIPDDCLPKIRIDSTTVNLFLKAIEEGMRDSFEELLREVNEEYPVTCIISDAFLAWTQDVALKFGICRASVWTSSTVMALICRNLDLLEGKGAVGKNRRGDVELIDFIPGLPPVPVAALPAVFRDPDVYERYAQERLQRYEMPNKDAWVLSNTFYELEKEQIDEIRIEKLPNFTPVGLFVSWEDQLTLSCPGLWNEDRSCLEWLDEQPRTSVLYISFGSLATLSLEQLREIYQGLLLAKQRFLWVIRADTLDKEDERNELVQEIRQSNKGMVVSWAPQLQVLQHESVAAFLSHCGWNSVTEAVKFGVPLLCWPCIAEQSVNAFTIVEQWKIGFYVRSHQETNANVLTRADRIEEVVTKIMGEEGDALRSRVKLLSDKAAAALAPGGSSDANLQAFIQDMKLRASQMKSNR